MKALLVKAGPECVVEEVTVDDDNELASLQQFVSTGHPHSLIESVSCPYEDTAIYCNEEGKIFGLPINFVISDLLLRSGHLHEDVIVGDVIITGFNPIEGTDHDVEHNVVNDIELTANQVRSKL